MSEYYLFWMLIVSLALWAIMREQQRQRTAHARLLVTFIRTTFSGDQYNGHNTRNSNDLNNNGIGPYQNRTYIPSGRS